MLTSKFSHSSPKLFLQGWPYFFLFAGCLCRGTTGLRSSRASTTGRWTRPSASWWCPGWSATTTTDKFSGNQLLRSPWTTSYSNYLGWLGMEQLRGQIRKHIYIATRLPCSSENRSIQGSLKGLSAWLTSLSLLVRPRLFWNRYFFSCSDAADS